MEKLKEALELMCEKRDFHSDLWGDQLALCIRLIEQGIAELEGAEKQRAQFTLKLDTPGTATGFFPITIHTHNEVP